MQPYCFGSLFLMQGLIWLLIGTWSFTFTTICEFELWKKGLIEDK